MIKYEKITTTPTFSRQLENKVLYSNHTDDTSISYTSTYTIKYVIEGTKKYRCNNQDIDVSKNQFLVLNNDSKITTEAKKGTKGISFFLSPELVNEICNYHEIHNTTPVFLEVARKRSTDETGLLLNKIAYLYENDQAVFKQQMDQLFILLSELIVKEQASIESKFTALKIAKHNTKKELFKLISLAKEYLNDNIGKNITLDILSRDVGLSKYYLHRLFTELNGNSPLTYLTQIRLEKAKNSLQHSSDSISKIATICGFGETAYFSNSFKKHTGLSPSQFRKRL